MSLSGTPSLGQRLASYSAAAGVTLAVLPAAASAQVVYTDVNPDATLATGADVLLDIDADGTDDFVFGQNAGAGGETLARVRFRNANAAAAAVNAVQGVDAPYFTNPLIGSASNLAAGAVVGAAGAELFSYGILASNYGGDFYYQFVGQEGYVGFRFQAAGGTTHFGWARVSVDAAAETGVVFEYAYEATPNTPITVGNTGTASEPDALAEGYRFSPLAPNPTAGTSTFELTVGQAENVRVEAFDALGRSVSVLHDGPMAGAQARRLSLDASGLPAGVYVVRVTGESFTTARRVTVAR